MTKGHFPLKAAKYLLHFTIAPNRKLKYSIECGEMLEQVQTPCARAKTLCVVTKPVIPRG